MLDHMPLHHISLLVFLFDRNDIVLGILGGLGHLVVRHLSEVPVAREAGLIFPPAELWGRDQPRPHVIEKSQETHPISS